jgi:hypothetical protein
MDSKTILSEVLGFYKYKIDNNLCTMSEMDGAIKALESNMEIYGTVDDFAKFYGKSKDAVNGIIKRNVYEKPVRGIVLRSFHKFIKHVPDSWRKKR